MGSLKVIDNEKDILEEAFIKSYRMDFIPKIKKIIQDERFFSGGYHWNLGYLDSGVWTYPFFCAFQDFDSVSKKVSLIFRSMVSTEEGMQDVSRAEEKELFEKVVEFATRIAEVTIYDVEVQKPLRFLDGSVWQ